MKLKKKKHKRLEIQNKVTSDTGYKIKSAAGTSKTDLFGSEWSLGHTHTPNCKRDDTHVLYIQGTCNNQRTVHCNIYVISDNNKKDSKNKNGGRGCVVLNFVVVVVMVLKVVRMMTTSLPPSKKQDEKITRK